jgi:poly(3-hydroxybutyrate) depolymerase
MIPIRLQIATAMLFLLAAPPASAQKLPPGPQVLTFFSNIDDTEQPYGLYLPKNFNPAKKYPLVVMLHGAGSNHRLALRRVFGFSNRNGETDVEATRYFPEWKDVDFIVASPLARGTLGYQGIGEKDVLDVLADVKQRFPIDEDRTYLTGLSMGGGGTLWIGLSHPDLWAAIAPVCPAPPRGTTELAPNALNYPVHFFQGGADPTVNPQGTRDWAKRLEELGAKVEYTEYPGVQHNSWEKAYADEAIFTWFAQFRRNRFPDRVRYVTDRYKYDHAFWVRIDQLTPGTYASVDARFTAPNRIEIATKDLGALTLNLAGHPKFNAARPLEVSIDGNSISAKVQDSLSLTRHDGKWANARYEAGANAKRPGAEGPAGEAIAARHIYVYGSADRPKPQPGAGRGGPRDEVLAQRRTQAADLADVWSRGRLMVFPRAVQDSAVRPSDFESANLVLLGTKESNSVIAKLADRLPMELKDATEYGLIYVYPVDGHYMLVCSPGVPAAPTGGRGRGGFSFGPAQVFNTMQDYIVYKGSPDNVVAQGRFDNNWRVPADDAEKIKATGAVTVR